MRLALKALVLTVVVLAAAFYFVKSSSGFDATAELRRSYLSRDTLSYVGTVDSTVFYCGQSYSTGSKVSRNESIERIEYLSGPAKGAVVIVTSDRMHTYAPGHNRTSTSALKPERQSGGELELLLNNYTPVAVGRTNILGRRVRIVDLTPKNRGNPSKRIWIDHETGLVVKSQDRSSSGEIRAEMEFKKLSFQAPDRNTLAALPVQPEEEAITANDASGKEAVEKSVGIQVSFPEFVPKGYVLQSVSSEPCPCACNHKTALIRYSNGLNSISIFQTPSSEDCSESDCMVHNPEKACCEVQGNCQARVIVTSSGGRTTIVVADLPDSVITRIADSVR